MLAKIGDKSGIKEFISQVKDKHNHEILFGFGHRVYKNYDPRAHVLRDSCHEVLSELGIKDDPLLDLAMELEKIALNDDYFISRKLYPNVDFYSGIILKAMGFPTSMFTVLFAIARTVGWIAQWTEMIEDPDTKIGRPRQLFTGSRRAPLRADRTARPDFGQGGRRPPVICRPPSRTGPPRTEPRAALRYPGHRPDARALRAVLHDDAGRSGRRNDQDGDPGEGDPLRRRAPCATVCRGISRDSTATSARYHARTCAAMKGGRSWPADRAAATCWSTIIAPACWPRWAFPEARLR